MLHNKTMINCYSELKILSDFLLLNASFSSNNSLQSGKLAVALFFYHAQKNDLVVTPTSVAQAYLDEIINENLAFKSTSYACGLLGGGVILEHLAAEGCLQNDPGEMLKEVEPFLLENIFSHNTATIDIATGITGGGLYLLHRLHNTTVQKNGSAPFYTTQLQLCLEQLVKSFPLHRSNEYLHQYETSIWNGLTGVLLFFNIITEYGLHSTTSQRLEKEIAVRLLQLTNKDQFSWFNAEAFFGLLHCHIVTNNKNLRDKLLESFATFVNTATARVDDIDYHYAAFYALLITLTGKKYHCTNAITLGQLICSQLKTVLTNEKISQLFDYNASKQTFEMGLFRGVCGTALPLLSLHTENYHWLKILGIAL
jgi:hypothetical protein